MSGDSPISSGPGPITRCVLWHAGKGPLPEDLMRSLRKRSIEIIEATDQYGAMARACAHERAIRSRQPSAAAARSDALVVLLVEPAQLEGAARVAEELRRFAPRTAVWWYHAGASPKLRPALDAHVESWREPQAAAARTGAGSVAKEPRVPAPVGADDLHSFVARPSAYAQRAGA